MIFALAGLVTFALDQYTKHLVVATFAPGESRLVVPHLLYWTYVENTHGAFGLFGNNAVLLIGMALGVLALFYYAFRDLAAQSKLVRAGFGAIVGGAIGNIVDRFHYQYVVDFIDLRWWPVFNVADSCITVGVALLVIATIVRDRAAAAAKTNQAS
jgi:signal peptidase II